LPDTPHFRSALVVYRFFPKPATLETGVSIEVPLFIEEGERVRVDTRTGAYVSRSAS
jgi:hypothetical protein